MKMDMTDPVLAALHAIVVQGGFSTPAIEADRMKADLRDAGDEQLLTWAAKAGMPTDGTREDLEQRMCARIDERLAAYEASLEVVNEEPQASPAVPDDGRPCELTYKFVVNVHPEDGEPDGGLPADVPVEYYRLPDDVAETLKGLGNEYLHEVDGVEPTAIRFLA